MKYETLAGVPTRGLTYAKLCDALHEAQDAAAMMAHLHQTEGNPTDSTLAHGWLGISELLKRMIHQVTLLAANKLQ